MDNTLNTFAKGMIKDVAETLRPEDSYEDAQDMKLNAGNSASEYIISNVKGNKLSFTVPDTPVLFTINKNDISLPANWSETIVITSSLGTFTGSAFTGTAAELDDYLDKIQESILEDPIFAPLNLNAARSSSRIRIWSDDITITNIQFTYSSVNVQQVQSDQQIIGWDVSNDVIVLFTTNDSSSTGGVGSLWKLTYDKVTFDTQIEILYSDDINFTTLQPIANPGGVEMVYERPSIHRIYWTDRMNNLRSLNIADPNLMALDPDAINVEANVILEKPHLQQILSGGGQLIGGHYQFSYYLQEQSGAITSYAPLSNSIYITDHVPNGSTDYQFYMGVPVDTQTGVSIEVEINNVNTNFSILNLIVVKKLAENAPPIIELIQSPIAIGPTVRYTYDGNEEAASITEIDFTAFRNTFDICHTIAQKDNILFAANTVGDLFDVDFDTRAYRFNATQEHDLRQDDGTSISITSQELLQPFELDNTSDAINNDQYFYKYQYTPDANGNPVIGGEGPHISYRFTNRVTHSDDRSVNDVDAYPFRLPYSIGASAESLGTGIDYQRDFFKDHKSPYTNHIFRGYRRGEKYRFAWVPVKNGIEGYARWIADIQMPEIYEDIFTSNDPNQETFITGDTDDTYQLGVEFTVNIPSDIANKIDSYKIKRVKLEANNRTILGQGIIQNTIKKGDKYHPILGDSTLGFVNDAGSASARPDSLEFPGPINNFTLNIPLQEEFQNGPEALDTDFSNNAIPHLNNDKTHPVVIFHSPEFLFGKTLDFRTGDKIKCIAGLKQPNGGRGNEGSFNYDRRNVFWKINNLVPLPGSLQNREYEVKDGLTVLKWSANQNTFFLNNTYEIKNRTRRIKSTSRNNDFDNKKSDGSTTNYLLLNEGLPLIKNRYNTSITNNTAFTNTGWLPGDEVVEYVYDVDANEIERMIGSNTQGLNSSGNEEDIEFRNKIRYAERPDKILVNYVREITNQYGGASYSARANNIYISTGTEVSLADGNLNKTFKVYGGDTFVNVFDTAKMTKNYDNGDDGYIKALVGLWFPVESFINLDMRHGKTLQNIQNPSGFLYGTADGIPNAEEFPFDLNGEDFGDNYNYVYSEEMDLQRSFPLPLTLLDVDLVFPTRIWASNAKVYGETIDSWRIFDSEKYLDIQGNFGEIRQLVTNNNTLYAWQEQGFGVVSVNERSITTDNSGSGVILGKSGVLPRFDYISESVGSWHQFSFATSPSGVLFFDKKDGGLYMFTQQGLRDVSAGKINSWLHENTRGIILNYDGPIGSNPLLGYAGMSSTYDYINKEFLITFFDRDPYASSGSLNLIGDSFTLAYSDTSDVFSSFRSFKPIMYINDNKNIFTPKPFSIPSEVYIHEEGERGVFYDNPPTTSSITTVINKEPFITKIFDNIRWLSEVFLPNGTEVSDETFSSIETFNTYQTTGVRTQFRRLMREWKHAIQYQFGTKNRIRSHYVRQKFEFLNNNDKEFRLHYIMNLFRKIMK